MNLIPFAKASSTVVDRDPLSYDEEIDLCIKNHMQPLDRAETWLSLIDQKKREMGMNALYIVLWAVTGFALSIVMNVPGMIFGTMSIIYVYFTLIGDCYLRIRKMKKLLEKERQDFRTNIRQIRQKEVQSEES